MKSGECFTYMGSLLFLFLILFFSCPLVLIIRTTQNPLRNTQDTGTILHSINSKRVGLLYLLRTCPNACIWSACHMYVVNEWMSVHCHSFIDYIHLECMPYVCSQWMNDSGQTFEYFRVIQNSNEIAKSNKIAKFTLALILQREIMSWARETKF